MNDVEMNQAAITGHTKLFCLLADPIGHVRTPQIFNDYLHSHGTDAVVVPAHVSSQNLKTAVDGLRHLHNLKGIIVTVPHKIAILDLCDELDPSAKLVGAVNIIKRDANSRLIGANFDGAGFAEALEQNVGRIAGKSVFMAGAGGVARAIAFNLARKDIAKLSIYNRSADKTDDLLAALKETYGKLEVTRADNRPSSVDIAINATSLGLKKDDPLPFAVDALPKNAVVAEVVMRPLMTSLLLAAQQRGLHIATGDAMLTAQLASWVEFIDGPGAKGTPVPNMLAAG